MRKTEFKPILAVIVPICNVSEYLRQCIESIVFQSFRNIEIILVDDGSTDGSGEICDEYAKIDSRIKVIHQNNEGVSAARYNGICHTNCEYITFVDADDWIDACTYEKVIPYIEDGYDAVSFGINRYINEDNIHKDEHHYPTGIYDRERLETQVFPTIIWDTEKHRCGIDAAMWNKVLRKCMLQTVLGDFSKLGIHYGEDVATIYFALMKARSLVLIDEYLYYHRQRTNGKIADYILDEEYIPKLYTLYQFMRDRMSEDSILIKQLEYFFLHGMEVRLWKYGDRRTIAQKVPKTYLFPFGNVDKGARVVLYGAGKVGTSYYDQVQRTGYCHIVYWIDRKFTDESFDKVDSINKIQSANSYDVVIIAIEKITIYDEIKQNLIENGVSPDKILCWEDLGFEIS